MAPTTTTSTAPPRPRAVARFLKPRAGETQEALAARVLRRAFLAKDDLVAIATRVYLEPERARPGEVQLLSAVIVAEG